MNTIVFFFTLIVVIEVLIVAAIWFIPGLVKRDNVVLALMGNMFVFVFVWLVASGQVDVNDSTAFRTTAFLHILGLVVITAGLVVIDYAQRWWHAHH